ncbi:MAG: flagellar hook-basal body complex protein [Clostridium sp.]|nr:flagellar hook-basal body complex protein [Clostridium sp.]
MLRAMDSAVAGLRSHQNKLDVIGNNISNVNTFGFKSQNYTFKDAMYQTANGSSGGKAPTGTDASVAGGVGGTNAAQFGYGSMQGTITTDMTSSTPSYVGGFNAAINGSGFFITKSTADKIDQSGSTAQENSDKLKAAAISYTRVGQLSVDANGFVVDANGNYVFGFQPETPNASVPNYDANKNNLVALRAPHVEAEGGGDPTYSWDEPSQLKSVSIDNDGTIKGVVDANGQAATVIIGKVAIASFQNQDGLLKAGNNTFTAAVGDNTGVAAATMPGGSTPTLLAGYLEASNVDLAKEFSDMITTQRGFQANTKMVTVSDQILEELVNMKR